MHGAGGTYDLTDGRVDGIDPLGRFSPTAADGLRRVDAMTECGDLVVVSMFDPGSGEVAPFEEQIGSHGGLGGTQSDAFILHPAEWGIDLVVETTKDEIVDVVVKQGDGDAGAGRCIVEAVWETNLVNPDFCEYARLCGGTGFSVRKPDELRAVSRDVTVAALPRQG